MAKIEQEKKLHELRFAAVPSVLGKINYRVDQFLSMASDDHCFSFRLCSNNAKGISKKYTINSL
jgi:hypothetical protein